MVSIVDFVSDIGAMKAEQDRHNKRVYVSFTPAQLAELDKTARELGISTAIMIRMRALRPAGGQS